MAEEVPGLSAFVLGLRAELLGKKLEKIEDFGLGDLGVEVAQGSDSIWLFIRRPGRGGLALRAAWVSDGGFDVRILPPGADEVLRLEAESVLGRHVIAIRTSEADLHRLQLQVWLTPRAPLLIPFHPRDLYVLDADDDPARAVGRVEAAQRGVNSGLLYFRLDEPAFGSTLYVQNLTTLNPYFRATDTVPDAAVGGEWPELGYLPPTPPQSGTPPVNPLPAGEAVMMSDAILVFRDWAADDELEMARQFLQMLGIAYKALPLPPTDYRDWVDRSGRTLKDLEAAPQATRRHYGHLYVMPYPDGEYPDVMVQASVLAAVVDYGRWRGDPHPLEAKLRAGLSRFYDAELETVRRYLPNVGDDKDADAVDSWYLYHPLLNFARLALNGDEVARELLMKSIGYGIRAAHHFHYAWPVMYDIRDFSVKTRARNDDRFGQTDVGGIYAYLMLLCYQLTDDETYLHEARAAIDAAVGMRFNLEYQANLTAWGAAACMRLWRITNDARYLSQSYVYLASFFHNCEIWESEIGPAAHYRTFLGATCLHDAPYMAIYECFDSFTAFEAYLADSGPDLEPAVRMLIGEYCRYALDRAWYYYPDALPADIIAEPPHQSGVINPRLSFPLEDLYANGERPGKVGQEIYGCGAAMVFASRSHHRIEDAPFLLFCDVFVRAIERTGERALTLVLDAGETCHAGLSLVRRKRRRLPEATLSSVHGEVIGAHGQSPDRIDFRVPASGRLILQWSA
ncbi:hypothetical protein GCM10011380_09330 [Sphingomonas metalli]|uniref:Uncharacterized protein n=1 Tax=Sphingomonas metalli TaxID=1779358 RepID=A0A916SX05_9SPHN|nr:hypothetical protein [Sphingomonas metalli]GGB21897.1 hypothetical protein GCM10011380_09330 [Sphingomonas metalli]